MPFVAPDPPAGAGALGGNISRSGDSLLVTWLEPASNPNAHRLRFSRWTNHAWGPPQTIAEGPQIAVNWADVPGVQASRGGRLVAHWVEHAGEGGYAGAVVLAQSVDGGKTWSRVGLAHDDGTPTEHGFVSLLEEGAAVRAFWLDGRETLSAALETRSMTLRTATIGATSAEGELLDARVCDCCGTAAAMTSQGPIVVFRDRSGDELRDISIIRRVDGAWTAPAPVHVDGWKMPGCPINGPAVAADGSRVAVAWYTDADSRPSVRVAFSTNAGETFSPPIEVDGPRGPLTPIGRVGIVLDDQAALVSWVTSDHERAEVLLRRVLPDKRRGTPVRLTQSRSDRASGFPRLARAGDEVSLIWTQQGAPSSLRFASWPVSAFPSGTEGPIGETAQRAPPIAPGSTIPE